MVVRVVFLLMMVVEGVCCGDAMWLACENGRRLDFCPKALQFFVLQNSPSFGGLVESDIQCGNEYCKRTASCRKVFTYSWYKTNNI